ALGGPTACSSRPCRSGRTRREWSRARHSRHCADAARRGRSSGGRNARMMKALGTDIGTIHFVGIGGIGMSGIAEVMHQLGYKVQGSDVAEAYGVEQLRQAGFRVI